MTRLLIALPISINNNQEWENTLNKFDEKDFYIYEVEGLNNSEYDIGFLPGLVEYYKNLHVSVEKIVVISDARDLIFTWFRCYNSLIDDYIYFIDDFENNLFSPQNVHYPFYFNMLEFNGITNELVKGKIYLSKKTKNYEPFFHNSKYFDCFDEYDFLKSDKKKHYNKKYVFNDEVFEFFINEEYVWQTVTLPKMKEKILFLKGGSQYEVLRVIVDYNAHFFERLGYEVIVIDLMNGILEDNLKKIIENSNSLFLFSTNCICLDIQLEKSNLYDYIDLPVVGTLGDHPINQLSRVIHAPEKCLFLCLDSENIKYFKNNFPDKKIEPIFSNAYPNDQYIEKSFVSRNIDILYAGSLVDPNYIRNEWKKYDKNIVRILNSLIDVAVENYFIDVSEQIERLLIKYRIKNYDVSIKAIVHSEFERYWRYHKRYKLLEILSSSDLIIQCMGESDALNQLNKNGNFIIQDKVDYHNLLKLMSDSKMVLNMTGHLYYGITERVLSAMINGAVAVTEEDRFTIERFSDGKNIVLYNYETIIEKMHYHLNNLDNLKMIARNGQIEAKKSYDYRIGMAKLPRIVNNLFRVN